MSIRYISLAFETPCASATEKLVLIKLADNANDDGECWPSKSHLERHTGLSKATIKRTIRKLEKAGLVKTEPVFIQGRGQAANRYRLKLAGAQTEPGGGHGEPGGAHSEPPGGITMSQGGAHGEPGGGLTVSRGGAHVEPPKEPSVEPSKEPPVEPPSKSQPEPSKTNMSSSRKNREPDLSGKIAEVFEHWRQTMNHPRAKLDAKRRRKIRDRLQDGYQVADLIEAINGCAKSAYHMGQNDTGAVYDDIELICRDATHVDRFIKIASGPDLTMLSPAARQTARAAAEWLAEGSA